MNQYEVKKKLQEMKDAASQIESLLIELRDKICKVEDEVMDAEERALSKITLNFSVSY